MRLDLSRRTDGELLREFHALDKRDHRSTAEMLAYVGEIQARRLFAPLGHSSMYKYCLHEMHWSEEMAWKRSRVAKLARRFPVILDMVAEGRHHLSGLVVLAAYKDLRGFPELLEVAVHKTRAEIELLLAERFPKPDAPTVVQPLATSAPSQGMSPGTVSEIGSRGSACAEPAEGPSEPATPDAVPQGQSLPRSELPAGVSLKAPAPELAPEVESSCVALPATPARIQPLAPQRFMIQVTVGKATHDLMRRAQDLLGHQVPSGDLEQVLARSFEALVRQLEHAKFAATDKPRHARQRSTVGKRHVPAAVKRAVHERDGGRCTFVSDSGHRCDERRDLQYDHIEPFARGGEATLNGIRLLCPTHNQYEAERVFGAGFMEQRRKASG